MQSNTVDYDNVREGIHMREESNLKQQHVIFEELKMTELQRHLDEVKMQLKLPDCAAW